MVAVQLLIFIIYFVYASFGFQNSGQTSWDVSWQDLITSKTQKGDCNITLDSKAFSACCDGRHMALDTVQSDYFRDEVYLCAGVYDVVLHICRLEKNNMNLSNSIQEVIKEMNGETKSEIYGVKSICNGMKSIKFEAASNDLEPWLSKLNDTLQDSCEKTCTKNLEVNPLCIFVLWGNTLRAESKVEKDNENTARSPVLPPSRGMNVNTSKVLKKTDEKTVNSQLSEKTLSQPKTYPPPTVMYTNFNVDEQDGDHNTAEEVSSKKQEDPPVVDGQNYDSSLLEVQDKLSDEPKISTSADTKQSLTTSSSNEPAQHSETHTGITNVIGDHIKDDMPPVRLSEPPATSWKTTSFTKTDVTEQKDHFRATQEEENDSGLSSGYQKHFDNAEDSHFFAYFMAVVAMCIIAYLIYHNKHKFLALILEGRRRRELRRRTTHGGYRKLDSSLEEAVTSTCSTSVTHVIY